MAPEDRRDEGAGETSTVAGVGAGLASAAAGAGAGLAGGARVSPEASDPCFAATSASSVSISAASASMRSTMLLPLSGSRLSMPGMSSSVSCFSFCRRSARSFSVALRLVAFVGDASGARASAPRGSASAAGGLLAFAASANEAGVAASAEPAAAASTPSCASPPQPESTPFHPPPLPFPAPAPFPPPPPPPPPPGFPPPPNAPPPLRVLAPSPALVVSSFEKSRSWSESPTAPSARTMGASESASSLVQARSRRCSASSSLCVADAANPASVHSNRPLVSSALKYRKWFPSLVPARLRPPLNTCRRYTFSSTVPQVTSRYTTTSRVWPMRYARSTLCESAAGFHEGS